MTEINAFIPYIYQDVQRTCEFKYDDTDPYAVTIWFYQPAPEGDYGDQEAIKWLVSREILLDSLIYEHWVGGADVKARRNSHTQIVLGLSNADIQDMEIFLPYAPVKHFLERTRNLVREGDEHKYIHWPTFDIERALWEILEG